MPPPRAEGRASKPAAAPRPSLFDRLRNGAKGKASATSEPEKDSRGARKEKTRAPPSDAKRGGEKLKKSTPSKAPNRTKPNPPTKAPPEPVMRANARTKRRAEDSEVRDYISRSYAPPEADDGGAGARDASKTAASSRLVANKPASMPPRPPQKVTVADLQETDRRLVARARAAMARVDPAHARLAAAAAAFVAARLLAKARRARRADPAAETKVELDIDSAFGTPTRAGASAPTARADAARNAKGKAPAAPAPATGTSSAKRLVFGDANRDRAAPAPNRFGVGADALAAAVHAKTTVIKATRRLKRAGELRVDVLEATFLAPPATGGGAAVVPDAFAFRVAVDADGATGPIRGATSARASKKGVVTFNSRLAFSLPASSDGHAGGRVEARLCDAAGRTTAKTAVPLRAALRAAPVTKAFPLHDRAGDVVGHARLAIEWDYEKARSDATTAETTNEREPVLAAAWRLAAAGGRDA